MPVEPRAARRDAQMAAAADGVPLRLMIVCSDASRRRLLAKLLEPVAGIEIAGWADSPGALAVLDACADAALVDDTGAADRPPAVSGPRLSPRQAAVLAAYAGSNELGEVVARQLGVNVETLKTHLRRIRAKYRAAGRPAPTRRDLYVRAVEDGLLAPPS
jgi:DNA-binding CsgD family transcriptional regulator